MALSERQMSFACEYMADRNAAAAAERAGYSRAQGYRLLKNPEIRAITEAKPEYTDITKERIIAEYAAIAFARVTDYVKVCRQVDDKGREVYSLEYRDTDELTQAQRSALSAVKRDSNGIVISTHDKFKALDFLARRTGIGEKEEKSEPITVIIRGDEGYSE